MKHYQKILRHSLLASALIATLALPASAFSDTQGHWASNYITTAISSGFMSGTSNTTFSPEKEMSYGEFAVVIVNGAFGGNTTTKSTDTHWSDKYLNVLSEANLLTTASGTAIVNQTGLWQEQSIPREDVASVIVRLMERNNYNFATGSTSILSSYSDLLGNSTLTNNGQMSDIYQVIINGVMKGDSGKWGVAGVLKRSDACVVFSTLKDKGILASVGTDSTPSTTTPSTTTPSTTTPSTTTPSTTTPSTTTTMITEITVTDGEDAAKQFYDVVESGAQTVTIFTTKGQESVIADVISSYFGQSRYTAVDNLSFEWGNGSGKLSAILSYEDSYDMVFYLEGKLDSLSTTQQLALSKAQSIQKEIIQSSMTELEKIKAIHDYIINNTSYEATGDRAHSVVGALIDGKAVCEGYTQAFHILCYLSGIDTAMVAGDNHVWNQVKVNGTWYHIDITWDDPTSSKPILRYDYFLISDSTIKKDHYWVAHSHIPVCNLNYNHGF